MTDCSKMFGFFTSPRCLGLFTCIKNQPGKQLAMTNNFKHYLDVPLEFSKRLLHGELAQIFHFFSDQNTKPTPQLLAEGIAA